jgi:hypothetical protein
MAGGIVTTIDLTVIQYINISALKLAIAEWHRDEFRRIENGYTEKTFFGSLFLDGFANGDGVFLQLAAAFDAFACAVASKVGLGNPHKADFGVGKHDLAKAAGATWVR